MQGSIKGGISSIRKDYSEKLGKGIILWNTRNWILKVSHQVCKRNLENTNVGDHGSRWHDPTLPKNQLSGDLQAQNATGAPTSRWIVLEWGRVGGRAGEQHQKQSVGLTTQATCYCHKLFFCEILFWVSVVCPGSLPSVSSVSLRLWKFVKKVCCRDHSSL